MLNIGITVGDANVGASFTQGCYKMDQGKLNVMVCLDKKLSTALAAAARKWEERGLLRGGLWLGHYQSHVTQAADAHITNHNPFDSILAGEVPTTHSPISFPFLLPSQQTAKVAYAKVDGVFQNGARPSCSFTWEGLDPTLFNALKTSPPQISVKTKEVIAATEKAAFTLLLPLEKNEGVFPITGSTGMMTMCSLVASGMPAVTAPLAPEPVATTPVEEAVPIRAIPPPGVVPEPEPAVAVIDKQEVTSPGAALKASALMTVALGVVTMLLIFV